MVLRWLVTDVLLPLKRQLALKGYSKLTSYQPVNPSSCSTSQAAHHHSHFVNQYFQTYQQFLKPHHGQYQGQKHFIMAMGFSPFAMRAKRQNNLRILYVLRNRLLGLAGQFYQSTGLMAQRRIQAHTQTWARVRHAHYGMFHFQGCCLNQQSGPSVGRILPELNRIRMQSPRNYATFAQGFGTYQQSARAAANSFFRSSASPLSALHGKYPRMSAYSNGTDFDEKMGVTQEQNHCPRRYRKRALSPRTTAHKGQRDFKNKVSPVVTHPRSIHRRNAIVQTTPVEIVEANKVTTPIVNRVSKPAGFSPVTHTPQTVAQKLEAARPVEEIPIPATLPATLRPSKLKQKQPSEPEPIAATVLVEVPISNSHSNRVSNATSSDETSHKMTYSNDHCVAFLLPGPPIYDHLAEGNNTIDYTFLEKLSEVTDLNRRHLDLISIALRMLRERIPRLEVLVDGFEIRVFVPVDLPISTVRQWLHEIGMREGNHYLLGSTSTAQTPSPPSTPRSTPASNPQSHRHPSGSPAPLPGNESEAHWTPSWTRWDTVSGRSSPRRVSAHEIHSFLVEADRLIQRSEVFATHRTVRDTSADHDRSSTRSLEMQLDAARSYGASMDTYLF